MKVLIIETLSTLRNNLRLALVNAGFEVIEARDEVEAHRLIIKEHSGLYLIISAVEMTNGNGLSLLHWVREEYNHIPVILMSSSSLPVSMNEQPDNFILKPLRFDRLMEVIALTLSRG